MDAKPKIWARQTCPCGCGSTIILYLKNDLGFMTKIPAGLSRNAKAYGLRRFRKEICSTLAILNAVKTSRATYEKGNSTLH